MARVMGVQQLASSTASRPGGEAAAEALLVHLAENAVEVTLDTGELVSASFLDELVRLVSTAGALDKVTFITSDAWTKDKLARISAVRAVALYASAREGGPREAVSPKRVELRVEHTQRKAVVH